MKHLIYFITLSTSGLLLQACGDTSKKTEQVPNGQLVLDLSAQGFPLCINVPDSTFGNAELIENANGIEIRIGNKYDILVNAAGPEDADMKQQKALASASVDVGSNNFMIDSDTLLVWETKFGDLPPQQHFYRLVKIGNDIYYVRDNNQNTTSEFSQADIQRMIESSRSLRIKPAPESK